MSYVRLFIRLNILCNYCSINMSLIKSHWDQLKMTLCASHEALRQFSVKKNEKKIELNLFNIYYKKN